MIWGTRLWWKRASKALVVDPRLMSRRLISAEHVQASESTWEET